MDGKRAYLQKHPPARRRPSRAWFALRHPSEARRTKHRVVRDRNRTLPANLHRRADITRPHLLSRDPSRPAREKSRFFGPRTSAIALRHAPSVIGAWIRTCPRPVRQLSTFARLWRPARRPPFAIPRLARPSTPATLRAAPIGPYYRTDRPPGPARRCADLPRTLCRARRGGLGSR